MGGGGAGGFSVASILSAPQNTQSAVFPLKHKFCTSRQDYLVMQLQQHVRCSLFMLHTKKRRGVEDEFRRPTAWGQTLPHRLVIRRCNFCIFCSHLMEVDHHDNPFCSANLLQARLTSHGQSIITNSPTTYWSDHWNNIRTGREEFEIRRRRIKRNAILYFGWIDLLFPTVHVSLWF